MIMKGLLAIAGFCILLLAIYLISRAQMAGWMHTIDKFFNHKLKEHYEQEKKD